LQRSLKIIELGVVTKETMTVEGMIKIVYDLLKDKLNIVKLTFTSGEFPEPVGNRPAEKGKCRAYGAFGRSNSKVIIGDIPSDLPLDFPKKVCPHTLYERLCVLF
jgi:hypothetical protein